MSLKLLAAALVLAALASPSQARERLCTPVPCRHTATVLPAGPDGRQCHLLAVSHGGQTKDEGVANAQRALKEMLPRWGRLNRVRLSRATVRAMEPDPNPFFRSEVTPALRIPPDVVAPDSHTVCWQGLVLPVACTAGARVCG